MSRFLDECMKFIETQPFEIIRISEIHNGGEIETAEGTESNPCQNTYSVAKTFTASAIGILYDMGMLSLNEKICDIFTLPDGADKRWYDCTVEMALTHSLGLPGGFLDIDVHKSSDFTDDFLNYMFSYPLEYDPGTDRKYSDGTFYLLSCVVEKKTGKSLDNFLWQEMLTKLDFQEMAWSHCPKGHAMGATGLYISSEDMVKLAQVYLDKGLYRSKRILSEEWVKLSLKKGFGWDETQGIFYKGGMCGQRLIGIPEQNRAVAVQSFGANTGVITEWIKNYKD